MMLRSLSTLLYPRACPGCDRSMVEDELCGMCARQILPLGGSYCQRCGEPYTTPEAFQFDCSNCAGRQFDFKFAVAGVRAEGLAREFVHRLKYGGQIHIAHHLMNLLLPALHEPRIGDLRNWTLVPVPLHAKRFRERGFNQAWEICRCLQKTFPGTRVVDALKRTQATQPQAGLKREERLANLRNAFALRSPSLWKRSRIANRILLIDDVFTTGSTAQECSRVLKEQGRVLETVVVTVARG